MLSFGIPREIVEQIIQHYNAEYIQINNQRTINKRRWCLFCRRYHIDQLKVKNVIETVSLDGDIKTALNFRLVCKDISTVYNPLDIHKRIGGTIGSKYNCNIIKTGTRLWVKELKMIEGYVITKRYMILGGIIGIMFRSNKDKFEADPTLIFDNDVITQMLQKYSENIIHVTKYGILKKKYTAFNIIDFKSDMYNPSKADFASLYSHQTIPYYIIPAKPLLNMSFVNSYLSGLSLSYMGRSVRLLSPVTADTGEKVGFIKTFNMDFDGDEENLINANKINSNDYIIKERQLLLKHGKWASTQRHRLRHMPLPNRQHKQKYR